MTASQIAFFVEMFIPLGGGVLSTLYGFRKLGGTPGDPRWDDWHRRYGGLLRVCGPLVILFSLWRIASPLLHAAAPEAPVDSHPYLPMRVGTTWVYTMSAGDVTARISSNETVAGVRCARREMLLDGKLIQWDHFRSDFGILCKHAYKGALFVPVLPLVKDLSGPETWDHRSSSGALEAHMEQVPGGTVVTPMGSFEDTVRVTMQAKDGKGASSTVQSWYARKVGLIRELTKSGDQEILIELKSFSPGP